MTKKMNKTSGLPWIFGIRILVLFTVGIAFPMICLTGREAAALGPTVVSTYPATGAANVSRTINTISVTFSKPMDTHFYSIGSTNWPSSTISWNSQGTVFYYTRTDDLTRLSAGSAVQFRINYPGYVSFKDLEGNYLPAYTLDFTIGSGFTVQKISADPTNGFYWPYYLSIPASISQNSVLLVEPNNTGTWSDDPAVHDTAAYNLVNSRSDFAMDLGVPLLVPTFPRPINPPSPEPGGIYTHALDRYSLYLPTLPVNLQRIDLQLIAMIKDAKKRLSAMGYRMDKKAFFMGFSASGAFVSRFTALHPEIVKAVAPGSPGGWPIAPLSSWDGTTLRYPVGVSDVEQLTGKPFALDLFRSVPKYIYVGDIDTNDALDTRDMPQADKDAICALLNCSPLPVLANRWPIAESMYRLAQAGGQFTVYPGIPHVITARMFSNVYSFFMQYKYPIIPESSVRDFSGDGKADILWRNRATGQNQIWLMNSTVYTSSVPLPTLSDTNWEIVGADDFDGDIKIDILWRHKTSGQNVIWLMNGPSYIGSVVLPALADTDWKIVGTGDFNGDGRTDILWRQAASGTVAIWLMNGTSLSSIAVPGAVPGGWDIKGVGDFNGDGKADILWCQAASGTTAIWLMNGGAIASVVVPGAVPGGWDIKGVGDFNGDGKADILWYQATSGTTAIWLMNGGAITSVGVPGAAAGGWDIKGIGDLNGDGKADVYWQHTSGAVAVWIMNGNAVSSTGVPGSVTSDWQIVNR
jgi:hypothetical protein